MEVNKNYPCNKCGAASQYGLDAMWWCSEHYQERFYGEIQLARERSIARLDPTT